MDQWRIVADSSCDLRSDCFSDIGFSSVPLKVRVDNTEYVDDGSSDPAVMLSHMKTYKGASSSSCPSPQEFAQEFRRAKNVIAITMTSGLSGTYNCAIQARQMVKEENPDANIYVVDSRSTAGSMVLLVRRVRELILEGFDFDEIVKQIERYRGEMRIVFSLASFDTLVKNGRMSRAAGLIATVLNIRAVATNTNDGYIKVLEKLRGESQAILRMVKLMGEIKDMTNRPAVITHCQNPDGANILTETIKRFYPSCDVTVLNTGCLTSYYAGENGLLLCF